ncbi:hypothetical protein N7448_005587 [Penicillium atrosanguineum]|uniref:mRNA stability protein n=1 Tax=Penicillium atrosanguineum TaxID=1132637 RepID=A0A9W9PN94_9EURO|nr:uncharacterized protein N7443_009319 [Penicillium atrosanguineum]KAJ5126276.1 hypothetical protein N7526_008453 [Penicillium atrosanguineum]KAJ5137033.1 hypothetical protein N7448_005587 [Penicillium atrosanguineum]KAJ5293366.1 hypothetical protein N7443_009319 [Penicillium atrosanguineum]KAJ5302600.1 hypothetical protein N7476_009399 [Penicillium atrosanguineum]
MSSGRKIPDPEPLSRSEERHFSKYGKLPRGGLLGQHSKVPIHPDPSLQPCHRSYTNLTLLQKERTYFDSGDFALSAADHETDGGAISTGRAHPQRDSISHPYAPIPAASNVNKDANEDPYRKSASPERSPLLQQTDVNMKNNAGERDGFFTHGGDGEGWK